MSKLKLEEKDRNFYFFLYSGLLFKRCTLLLPTKERLKFIFSKMSQVRHAQINIIFQIQSASEIFSMYCCYCCLYFSWYKTLHCIPVLTVFYIHFILLRFPASPWTSVCHQAALASPAMGSSFGWVFIKGQMSEDKLLFIHNSSAECDIINVSCVLLQKFLHMCLLLHMSQTLIAGWDKLECHRVFNFLCEDTHLLKNIEAVLTERPGE